ERSDQVPLLKGGFRGIVYIFTFFYRMWVVAAFRSLGEALQKNITFKLAWKGDVSFGVCCHLATERLLV
ncbi:MAG: hypothetical protein IIW59_04955, partial [Alistipes sp.]|nr:hypothetical protein [Alistipes sp.]